MRKAFSILMVTLMLMTGLHLSFDSHFCGGQLSAVNFSITGPKATCGMEDESGAPNPAGNLLKKHCCDDDLVNLTADSDYNLSDCQFSDFAQKVIHFPALPLSFADIRFGHPVNFEVVLNQETVFQKNSVALDAICVFRI